MDYYKRNYLLHNLIILLIKLKGYDKSFRRILAGVTSGIVTMLFTYPLDVIRVRLATDMSKSKDDQIYKGLN